MPIEPSDPKADFKLDDASWKQIQGMLPDARAKKRPGRPRMDDRRSMTAILYVLYTGCRWKALPAELGAASTVHDRFQEWRAAGVFERMRMAGLLDCYPEDHTSRARL